ncbi:hypothetical protein KUTeg_016446 [Tegillarca granosa]|uniref:Uncharacterized protein n=1 Tax=Tegillarca granosa TaxID=220873 RepID=A0ABQ9EKV9_TEGGR|nr:hypothetical protein KUTeg_016446 [Tegillarca granosa]
MQVLLLSLYRNTHAWHDFTNTDYHCWPLTASAHDPVPYNPCPGCMTPFYPVTKE